MLVDCHRNSIIELLVFGSYTVKIIYRVKPVISYWSDVVQSVLKAKLK